MEGQSQSEIEALMRQAGLPVSFGKSEERFDAEEQIGKTMKTNLLSENDKLQQYIKVYCLYYHFMTNSFRNLKIYRILKNLCSQLNIKSGTEKIKWL